MCHGIKGSNSFRDKNLSLISQHLVQFNFQGPSAGGDVMDLIYRVTLHGHFIEGSLKIYGWSSFCYVTTLINLVAISIALVEICF